MKAADYIALYLERRRAVPDSERALAELGLEVLTPLVEAADRTFLVPH